MNGQLCVKYGYRYVMIIAMFFMTAFIFVVFFAQNVATLLVGQILCGFSWGVFAVRAERHFQTKLCQSTDPMYRL